VTEEIDSEEAQAIFQKVGQTLKAQRELLGLSLKDVIRHTHLREHYLSALETGSLKDLPSPVQGRGMLKNYAVFLGLDPEPLLLNFAEGLQARLAFKQARRLREEPEALRKKSQAASLPLPVRRIFSTDLMIGGMLALFLTGFIVWGAVRIFSLKGVAAVTPTAPSIADVLLESQQTPTATLEPVNEAETDLQAGLPGAAEEAPPLELTLEEEISDEEGEEGASPPPAAAGSVQVYITISQRAWMRVTVDGRVEFDGRVIPGSAYTFAGEKQIELLTGNAAALRIFFNQQDLGALGSYGEIVNQIYTLEGIVMPTPTVTPTGTATPRLTATPKPTSTPRPGDTPVVPALP
jgi:cytoskeletal protein RodZ